MLTGRSRSAHEAIRHVHKLVNGGYDEVVDADSSGYFDNIPARRTAPVGGAAGERRVDAAADQAVADVPVEETGRAWARHRTTRNRTKAGHPQGAPISPLLANLYMRRFLLGWKVLGHARRLEAHIVNYADDFVICCRRGRAAKGQSRACNG